MHWTKSSGARFLDGLVSLHSHFLLVSGRTSFEIIKKRSPPAFQSSPQFQPSSLAVGVCARQRSRTLIGFLRPPSFNIYSRIEHVIMEAL